MAAVITKKRLAALQLHDGMVLGQRHLQRDLAAADSRTAHALDSSRR